MNERLTVHKLNAHGEEVWSYPGRLLERTPHCVTLEGHFDRQAVLFHGLTLRPGDRMVETFYDDRFYNVFAIYDGEGEIIKGWYCNVTRPARLEDADVYAEDLELDLLVFPSGESIVLDEAEFESLALPPEEKRMAMEALAELQELAAQKAGPFAGLP